MKATAPLFLALFLAGCAAPGAVDIAHGDDNAFPFAGTYSFDGPLSTPLTPPTFQALPPELHRLTMEDGVEIAIAVVRPDAPGPLPAILTASPYWDRLDEARMANIEEHPDFMLGHGQTLGWGFAAVLMEPRGFGASTGCVDFMGERDRADISAVIDWIAEQPWSNANVGMGGGSYPGGLALAGAATGNPHLKAVVASAPVSDTYRMMIRNGSVHPLGLAVQSNYYLLAGGPALAYTAPRGPVETATSAACPGLSASHAEAAVALATVDPEPGPWYAERDQRPLIEERYRGALLITHGYQDGLVEVDQSLPWARSLASRGIDVRQLFHHADHAAPDAEVNRGNEFPGMRWDWAEVKLRFWQRTLLGQHVAQGPASQVQDSMGRWRGAALWPPTDAVPTSFALGADGTLGATEARGGDAPLAPGSGSGLHYASLYYTDALRQVTGSGGPHRNGFSRAEDCDRPVSPADTSTAPTCLAFEMAVAEKEWVWSGVSRLRVDVTPGGPGGFLGAALVVLPREGEPIVAAFGGADLRVATPDGSLRSVAPGARTSVDIEMDAREVVVPEGARVFLALTTGGAGDRTAAGPQFPMTVHLGPDARLTLPVYEPDPADHFEPPMPPAE